MKGQQGACIRPDLTRYIILCRRIFISLPKATSFIIILVALLA
jgi:hypothetical protein